MNITIKNIEKLLIESDVEGLFSLGCPEDEYKDEARQIFEAIQKLERERFSEENITAIISLIWARAFAHTNEQTKQRLPTFRALAQKIVNVS